MIINKKNIIITGASGWIGQGLVNLLKKNYDDLFNIFALSASQKELILADNTKLNLLNFYEPLKIKGEVIIFHLAHIGPDISTSIDDNVFKELNQKIIDNLEKIIDNNRVLDLVYISSGSIFENKSLYSNLKIKYENFFKELCFRKNINLLIPRLFNLGGPYINRHQHFALSDFILQALKNNVIHIKSATPTFRSYIHIYDFLEICLRWVLDIDKENLYEFETRGLEILEMADLANLVSKHTNQCLITRNSINKITISEKYLGSDNYFGNIDKQNFLTKKFNIKIKPASQIVIDTIDFLREQYNLNI